MNDEKWFSAKLRFAVLVESIGGDTLYDRLFMLKATDFDTAFDAAILIGEAQETEYYNKDKKRVAWRFVQILSIDVILKDDLDGAEVHSESVALGPTDRVTFEQQFSPRSSKPIQTI